MLIFFLSWISSLVGSLVDWYVSKTPPRKYKMWVKSECQKKGSKKSEVLWQFELSVGSGYQHTL